MPFNVLRDMEKNMKLVLLRDESGAKGCCEVDNVIDGLPQRFLYTEYKI